MSDDRSRWQIQKPITFRGYSFIALWVLIAIIVSIYVLCQIISLINEIKLQESANYQIEAPNAYVIKSDSLEDANGTPNAKKVLVGAYLDHIREFNIRDSRWSAVFYIWFNWLQENGIEPGKNLQVINGYIDKDDKISLKPLGGLPGYDEYQVVTSIEKEFDVRLYPCDFHFLTIKVEDSKDDISKLEYVADYKNSTISDRLNITGIEIIEYRTAVKLNTYETTFGDPTSSDHNSTSSQFNFIILLKRSNMLLLFTKLFQGVFVAVLVSMLAFYIRPTWVDPRFGLGIGGLFAAVANNYIVSSALPIAGIVTLSGIMHGIGISVIFISIAQSVISLYIYDTLGAKSYSKLFDKVSFFLFTSIFIIIVVTIYLLASNTTPVVQHQVFFEKDYGNDDNNTWKIANPSISTAIYASLEESNDIDYYTLEGQRNQSIIIRIEIPEIAGEKDFAPAIDFQATVGPSEYPANPKIELINISKMTNETPFFSQLTGTRFLTRKFQIILPANGRYTAKVYDPNGQPGHYVFLIGDKKTWGGDPEFDQKMRSFLKPEGTNKTLEGRC